MKKKKRRPFAYAGMWTAAILLIMAAEGGSAAAGECCLRPYRPQRLVRPPAKSSVLPPVAAAETCEQGPWGAMVKTLAFGEIRPASGILIALPPGEYRWTAEAHGAYVQYMEALGADGVTLAHATGNSEGKRDSEVSGVSEGRRTGVQHRIGEGKLKGPATLTLTITHSVSDYGPRIANLWKAPDPASAPRAACASMRFCIGTEDGVILRNDRILPDPSGDADYDDGLFCIEKTP